MDADKIKNKRKALKCGATKFVDSLDTTLVIESNVHTLEILYHQLIEKIDSLKVSDNELLSVIDAKDIEKEVEQNEAYMENLISYKCKITQKIASLTNPVVPPTFVNPTNVPSSTIDTVIQEPSRKNKSDNWDLKALLEFLGEEIQSRERAQSFHSSVKEKQIPNSSNQECSSFAFGSRSYNRSAYSKQRGNNSSAAELLVNHSSANNKCIFCGENLHDSSSWDSVSIEMKRDHLKRNKLCFFCFSGRHSIAFCPKLKKEKGCSFCGLKSHSKTLCYRFHQNNSDKTTSNSRKEESDDNVASVSSCQTETKTQRVSLQTAFVVARYNKQFRNCRLLADTAAQRSFVERKFSRLLKLPVIRKEKLLVYSFGDTSLVEKTFNVVKIRLENKDDPNSYLEIEALETEKISAAHIPPPDIDISIYSKHLKGLKLADTTNSDANVSVLIGADNYYDVMTGRIKRISRKLVAAESLYGWCLIRISGPRNKNSSDSFAMKVVVEEDISKQLEAFWQLENLGIEPINENLNCKDNKILQEFEENIQFRDSRYVVKLPWKDNLKESLDNNYEIAHERFSKLCHKFKNDQSLYTEYKNVIDSYVEQNIVERVPNSNVVGGAEFYLPHRAVIRHDRVSSKLRIVFDASSHKRGKFSLNDSLHIGPNLYPDLYELLLSFRKHPIAFTVDIKQAFLNVELDDSDKNVTKFFCTDNPESFSESIEVLRFNRVLFGINSSPFLLTATIKYHLKKYSSLFPQTHELLNKFVYVDDVLGGQSTVASAYTTSVECVQIFSEANMPLHKWATNSAELRELWEKNGFSMETSSNSIGQNMINYKVLGISWDTDRDVFYFDIENLLSFISKGTDTKRFLLQVAGRIFDPLGLIAPNVIRLKVLIQNVWEMGLLWDQEMPQIVKKLFKEWCHELKHLHLVSIPRFYDFTDSNVVDVQLHSFPDSELKDSELWWHGPPWLKQTEQFWPKIEKQNVSSLNLELKNKFRDISQNEVILENREKLLNIDKFSSYLKLLRVTAFVFRNIYNTRNTLKKRGAVDTEELKKSEEYWIKVIQKETYGSEIIDLEETQKVSDCSKVRSLVPYLDDRQILRIKGRLDESELSLDEKQPILLPQNSKFTELLILREHTKNFHSGVTTTMVLRRKFWIPKGRQLVKKII
ncbi:integrase catalytic domain-containing protein [Nephila pilipes]|uniref:Integrase catalytic domain-containing protein n=1 Tax=Nephila pilipes TaxID=299642 RepID=A0A8X6PUK9_NEPPI|nr:integrase catalytic domain-containing protein [Nephila pilipes]